VESTVLDVTGERPVLLRPGGVALEILEAIIGPVIVPPSVTPASGVPVGPGAEAVPGADASLRRSPGTRYRHYAPRARVVLIESPSARVSADLGAAVRRLWDEGLRVGVMITAEAARAVPPDAIVRIMGSRSDPATIAANLFAQLRELDDAGLDAIVVEGIPERGVGRAVMDRLRRAAQHSNNEANQPTPQHQPR
jgi:L-threonylcarbamoyladenylate synthase